jgi:hypothetical protein
MTQSAIQEQVDAIRKATDKALKSKEAANKFLIDAGIIKKQEIKTTSKKK